MLLGLADVVVEQRVDDRGFRANRARDAVSLERLSD